MKKHTFETYQKKLNSLNLKNFEHEPIAKLCFAFYTFITKNYEEFIDDCGFPYSSSSINREYCETVLSVYHGLFNRIQYLNRDQVNYFIQSLNGDDFKVFQELRNVRYKIENAEKFKPENLDLFHDQFKAY
jgi:hypothetical protein